MGRPVEKLRMMLSLNWRQRCQWISLSKSFRHPSARAVDMECCVCKLGKSWHACCYGQALMKLFMTPVDSCQASLTLQHTGNQCVCFGCFRRANILIDVQFFMFCWQYIQETLQLSTVQCLIFCWFVCYLKGVLALSNSKDRSFQSRS